MHSNLVIYNIHVGCSGQCTSSNISLLNQCSVQRRMKKKSLKRKCLLRLAKPDRKEKKVDEETQVAIVSSSSICLVLIIFDIYYLFLLIKKKFKIQFRIQLLLLNKHLNCCLEKQNLVECVALEELSHHHS